MKIISQVEFEELVQSLIDGKITRKKLAKILDTDIRTINNKITQLSNSNPELYEKYVQKFPYKPKTREDIDYEALIIYAMKNEKTLAEVSEEYEVSIRTISRRVKDMEKTNPELSRLYRTYAENLKKGGMLPFTIQAEIDDLDLRPVILSINTEIKEKQLRETLQKFEKLLEQGMSKAEAARALGYDNYTTIWKKQQELKRIETEKKVIKPTDSKSNHFRKSMIIETQITNDLNNGKVVKKDTSTQHKVKEGR